VRSQEHLAHRRRYRLLHPLPPYLIFHIKRFSRNKFVDERNPTIVTFPTRSLDMAPYVEPAPPPAAAAAADAGAGASATAAAAYPRPGEPIWYDLVANITHEALRSRDDSVEGETLKKVWRVQLRDRARDEWVQVQDLFVEQVRKEILFLGESYIQVWEKRREPKKA
jgi:U4/U6.U5 tri-snRNP-associated protein 2